MPYLCYIKKERKARAEGGDEGPSVAACGSLTGACVRASAKLCSARWPARPFPTAQEFHLCAALHLHILSCKLISSAPDAPIEPEFAQDTKIAD